MRIYLIGASALVVIILLIAGLMALATDGYSETHYFFKPKGQDCLLINVKPITYLCKPKENTL